VEPIGDPDDVGDFAEEHEQTTVDPEVTGDQDDGESESPDGWAGLDGDGPP
jgi:hypothetical protein